MTIGRLEVLFHVHWWSQWELIVTGGVQGRLRARVNKGVLTPMETRSCRCGATQQNWAPPERVPSSAVARDWVEE